MFYNNNNNNKNMVSYAVGEIETIKKQKKKLTRNLQYARVKSKKIAPQATCTSSESIVKTGILLRV